MSSVVDNLVGLLNVTVGGDTTSVIQAEAMLQKVKSENPLEFSKSLLMLACSVPVVPASLPAATYLKNMVRDDPVNSAHGLQPAVFMGAMMSADRSVINVLAETFRLLLSGTKLSASPHWAPLLQSLRGHTQESNLMEGKGTSPIKTENALVATLTLCKQFRFFQNPTLAKEEAPPELEAVTQQLLEPLLPVFTLLVGQLVSSRDKGEAPHDSILLLLLKSFHNTVRSYMPKALLPRLPLWLDGIAAILDSCVASVSSAGARAGTGHDSDELSEGQRARLSVQKRALKATLTLLTRHRQHVEKHLNALCGAAAKVTAAAANVQDAPAEVEQDVSLAFDVLARAVETGPGFSLSSHVPLTTNPPPFSNTIILPTSSFWTV
eukprot:jgi/Mesvir1/18390/Mv14271-RA.1